MCLWAESSFNWRCVGIIKSYTILGNQNDQMGYSIDSAGDLNEDGLTDIILGAPYNRESGFGQGTSNGKVTFLMACEQ